MNQHIKNSPNIDAPANLSQKSIFSLEHPNILSKVTDWDIDFRQIGTGQLKSQVVQQSGCGCTLSKIEMSTSVHQTGQPPRDCITFGIPDPEGLDSWQSGEFGCDALLTFGAAEGFESISNERHVGIVLQFKEADLKAFSEASGYDLPDMVYNTQMFQAGGQRQRLRELKNRILLLLGSDTVRWSVSLREELMLQAIAVLSGGRAEIAKRSSAKRRTILKKTVGLMKDTEDRVVPISSMCKEVGASWRTINRAFFDEFGMGPKAYYTRLRLNRARLAIIRGEGAISISDAANRFEFWHMGQFARDYRSLFGELPSETLNRIKTQYIPGLR